MTRILWLAAAAAALVLTAGAEPGAQSATTNPRAGDADAIRGGTALYRARCANCHGMDARGVRGPDLTATWAAGRSDDGLHETIRKGIPGTEMPPINPRSTDDDIWKILAYLRTLAVPASGPVTGNAENGARIFRATCAGCHRVDAQGGRLGPDLSRVGAARTRAALTRQIRGATEDFLNGYEPVTLTMINGQTVRGVKKNEDLFSVQIMDSRERIQGYVKGDLRAFQNDTRSAMPVYGPERLNQSDLEDLLAYLATLRGPATAAAP
jgi:putative heme-binding domain-containing protein